MSKETIAAIRESELAAERIRAEAAAKSTRMIADERAAGEKLLAEAEEEVTDEINERFAALGEGTERLLEKNRAEAQEEADEIKRSSQLRIRAAINEIFRGLDRQCQ